MDYFAQEFDNETLSQSDTQYTTTIAGHEKANCSISKSGDLSCPQCFLNDLFKATAKVIYENTTLEPISSFAIMAANLKMEKLAIDEISKLSIRNLYEDFRKLHL
ncbi:hypothetical protein [Mucilaginibacter sp.]|uniref:hypothetical protein n=1 Tax=Mucilaginibacter sp. TaxID=1882438 RepID=UPI002615CF5B|nr:hypothetical protein [Mucilaginibacter sp.]